jgi:hypothetical protein
MPVDVAFEGGWAVIQLHKAVLVLSRQTFIDGLKRGKRFRRRQSMANRLAQEGDHRARESLSDHRLIIGRVSKTGPKLSYASNGTPGECVSYKGDVEDKADSTHEPRELSALRQTTTDLMRCISKHQRLRGGGEVE